MLARIKLDDPSKRERRRKLRRAGFSLGPAVLAFSLHAAILALLGALIFRSVPEQPSPVVALTVDAVPELPDPAVPAEPAAEPSDSALTPGVAASAKSPDEPRPSPSPAPGEGAPQTPGPIAPETENRGKPMTKQGSMVSRRAGNGPGGDGNSGAIDLGLLWLKKHQDEDGKWDWAGYTKHCRPGRCSCPHS